MGHFVARAVRVQLSTRLPKVPWPHGEAHAMTPAGGFCRGNAGTQFGSARAAGLAEIPLPSKPRLH